ncbi:DNA alkylation repair protein [Prevotella dentasini]|uniref:DNA alkylation repair protein n=1 Tax=Prevotella dentasini TaxID=589537 RepID=UPI0004694093|nr:DNA alkylation repair protein [Prevotella dentasini]
MTEETKETIRKIKQSFRLSMNGVTSQSMRQKGIDYKLNWGVPLPELKEMAKEYGKNYDLAIELWKENIRECKILATYIVPAEKLLQEVADLWMEQATTQEMAELLAFNVFRHLEFAPALAYEYVASDKSLYQICGFQLLACLFSDRREPNERGINEFLDQVQCTLEGNNIAVKHAAYSSLMRFCDMGEEYETMARKALAKLNIL